MPNTNYQPNQPQYYSSPYRYPNLTDMLNPTCVPADAVEREVFNANQNNLYAFIQSLLPDTVENTELMESFFGDLFSNRPEDRQRGERHELSQLAREQILNLVMDYRCSAQNMDVTDRAYLLLASRGRTEKDQAANDIVYSIIKGGDATEKGRLFDQVVKENMTMLKKILSGISDREMLDHFKEFQICQNVVFNAENIRNLADKQDPEIVISQQTREYLDFMQKNSLLVDVIFQRAKAIANPFYEFVDMEALLQMSDDEFATLQETLSHGAGESVALDYMMSVFNIRNDEQLLRREGKIAMTAALSDVSIANEGFFIGSRAYSQAFRKLDEVTKFMNAMGEPPTAAELAIVKPMLRETMQKCDVYMNTKDPLNFKNQREEIRYNAMLKAYEGCKLNLDFYELQTRAELSEKRNFYRPNPDVEFPDAAKSEVRWQIHAMYGEAHAPKGSPVGTKPTIRTTIPESNVGNIADELRANIFRNLTKLLLDNQEFDPELAGNIMGNMVVLEMVKRSRSIENGKIIAGPVEQELARQPVEVIDRILDNNYFRAMTANVTKEMLEHFVVSNGAKTVTDNMERIVRIASKEIERPQEPQAQNEMINQFQ